MNTLILITRNTVFILAGLVLVACASEEAPLARSAETATAAPAAAAVGENRFGMQIEQLAENVYAIVSPARTFPNAENLGWNSNAAFVVTREGVLMIDTGSSLAIGEALREMVRSVTDQPVRWIVNTHVHGDHWLGNGAFLADEPEQILAADIVIGLMHEQGAEWVSRFNNMTDGVTGEFEPVPARDAISETGSYQFADLEAVILRTERAHSPGDLAVYLPQTGVMLASDVVYTGRGAATFDSHVQGWIAFLEEMSALQPEVVLPGHGRPAGLESISEMRDFFQTLWDIVEAGYEAGQMDYEIAEHARTVMAPFEETYPGMSDSLGEAVSHVYLQVEAAMF
ncbi:MAG: MBL fold metallo-hydrolase [Chromatiales bacterium]|nr:MBL fold metallo-hydrolase [Gammaproteobacteria bacterium]MBW6476087.1 MBL fold metallo-hydrolase [Chromatiales bacterium]